ncbi:MAG TPA: hypothetical protein VIS74_02670 [Chthoniobacterales bacterium]
MTGLSDYFARLGLKGSPPLSRDYLLRQKLNSLWPEADFSKISISDVADIAVPLRLESRVSAAAARWPGIESELLRSVAAPERDRDLLLNDGQPLVIEQRVRLELAGAPVSRAGEVFEKQAAGQHFSIRYEWKDERTVERVALCEIRQPRISANAYPAFRAAFRQWMAALDQPLPASKNL